jgi:hypothetical protein
VDLLFGGHMDTIAKAFDLGLKNTRTERPSSTPFRGSTLGGCLRAQHYSATGVEPSNPFEPRLYRIFEQGHVIADVLYKKLEASGLFDSIQFEVPVVWEEKNFSGNIDILVQWKGATEEEVIELKSMNSRGFTYLKSPKPEHAIQAASYALAREHLTGSPVTARVVYVSKDDFRIAEYTVGSEWYDKALRVLDVGNKFLEQGRIPWRLPLAEGQDVKKKWPCAGCQWLTKCRG